MITQILINLGIIYLSLFPLSLIIVFHEMHKIKKQNRLKQWDRKCKVEAMQNERIRL